MNQMIDNYDLWRQHDAEQNRLLSRLPVCSYCVEPAQDEHFYLINDEVICMGCLNDNFRKAVDDYVG